MPSFVYRGKRLRRPPLFGPSNALPLCTQVLAAGHASVVAAQDTRTFAFLMSSLEMGLK